MNSVIVELIRKAELEQKELLSALANTPFDSLYQVGRTQGKLDGLKLAMQLLHGVIEDQDKS